MPPERPARAGHVRDPARGGSAAGRARPDRRHAASILRGLGAGDGDGGSDGAPGPLVGAAASVKTEAGNVQAVLTAPDTPSAHPLAVAKFKLRIWEQWGGGDLELVSPDLELQGGVLEWTGASRPEAGMLLPLVLHVAVIDPLGRESALVKLTAA